MKKSAFKLRSGNSPLFKRMGNSPMKQKPNKYFRGTGMSKEEYYDKKYKEELGI